MWYRWSKFDLLTVKSVVSLLLGTFVYSPFLYMIFNLVKFFENICSNYDSSNTHRKKKKTIYRTTVFRVTVLPIAIRFQKKFFVYLLKQKCLSKNFFLFFFFDELCPKNCNRWIFRWSSLWIASLNSNLVYPLIS